MHSLRIPDIFSIPTVLTNKSKLKYLPYSFSTSNNFHYYTDCIVCLSSLSSERHYLLDCNCWVIGILLLFFITFAFDFMCTADRFFFLAIWLRQFKREFLVWRLQEFSMAFVDYGGILQLLDFHIEVCNVWRVQFLGAFYFKEWWNWVRVWVFLWVRV